MATFGDLGRVPRERLAALLESAWRAEAPFGHLDVLVDNAREPREAGARRHVGGLERCPGHELVGRVRRGADGRAKDDPQGPGRIANTGSVTSVFGCAGVTP